MKPTLTTVQQVRADFWQSYPVLQHRKRPGRGQNQYRVDIRQAFCDHVEHLYRTHQISEELAQKVTL